MPEQGLEAERVEVHARIARENGEKIIARPEIALDAITRQQATFTRRDLAQFAFRHSDGKDQFDQVMSAVRTSPELVALGKDGRGEDRFTRSDEHTSELQSLMRNSYAVFCLYKINMRVKARRVDEVDDGADRYVE